MPTRTAAQQITAALTAVLVACALVVLGGTSHSTTPASRLVVGHSHVGSGAPSSLLGSTADNQQHSSSHPDLVSTPPSLGESAPVAAPDVTPTAYASRVVRDLATPNGRGPPAL